MLTVSPTELTSSCASAIPASKGTLFKRKVHYKCILSINIHHVVKYCHWSPACYLLRALATNQLVHGIDPAFRTVIVHNHLWLLFVSYFFSFTQVHCTHKRDHFSFLRGCTTQSWLLTGSGRVLSLPLFSLL